MDQDITAIDKDEAKKSKPNIKRELLPVSLGVGIFSGIFSLSIIILSFYGNKGAFSADDFEVLCVGLAFGAISFLLSSPWKRINNYVGGIFFSAVGIWLLYSSVIWAIIFFLIALSYFLHIFNTTLTEKVSEIIRAKTTRLILKILLWTIVVAVGLLILFGLFSWVAGLSATTVIIILLILIWLK